jgi:hypothetical protein
MQGHCLVLKVVGYSIYIQRVFLAEAFDFEAIGFASEVLILTILFQN